jgi:hypothetical protein
MGAIRKQKPRVALAVRAFTAKTARRFMNANVKRVMSSYSRRLLYATDTRTAYKIGFRSKLGRPIGLTDN